MNSGMGPCNAACEGCKWLYRPAAECIPLCEYYLKHTGYQHRYAAPDGTCAVWEPKHPGRTQKPVIREKTPQKQPCKPPRPWDKDTGLAMWLRGERIKDIAAAVDTSAANICKYARNHWYHLEAQRNAAIAAKQEG